MVRLGGRGGYAVFVQSIHTRQLRFPKRYGFRLFIHPSIPIRHPLYRADSDDPPFQQLIHNPNHQSTSTSTMQYMPSSSTFSSPSQNTIPVLPSHPPNPSTKNQTIGTYKHHPIQKNAINIQASPSPKTNTQTKVYPNTSLQNSLASTRNCTKTAHNHLEP